MQQGDTSIVLVDDQREKPFPMPICYCSPRVTTCRYVTVKQGDTCYDIWVAAGLSEAMLVALNPGVKCSNLQIGQKLCVKAASGRHMALQPTYAIRALAECLSTFVSSMLHSVGVPQYCTSNGGQSANCHSVTDLWWGPAQPSGPGDPAWPTELTVTIMTSLVAMAEGGGGSDPSGQPLTP